MDDFATILKTFGSLAGAIITIITFLALIMKKPKQWLVKTIKEQSKDDNEEIKNLLKEIDKKLNINREATLAALRHEITKIYDTYYTTGSIPVSIRKDLISLYNAYSCCGGNSYVCELYKELIDLPSVS